MKNIVAICLLLLIAACAPTPEQEQMENTPTTTKAPSLQEVWASDTLLRTPEAEI